MDTSLDSIRKCVGLLNAQAHRPYCVYYTKDDSGPDCTCDHVHIVALRDLLNVAETVRKAELPKISEAEPINITDGMDSVEYVRRIRDGKEKTDGKET